MVIAKTKTGRSLDSILRRVTLRELRLLLAVSSAGSIFKASEAVGLSQPAVSRAIADLEGAMGVRLFDRTNRGVAPTPQGNILLERAQMVFAEMRTAIEEIDALTDGNAGEVRVGGTPAMCGGLLAHVISMVVAARPLVRHQIEEMDAQGLVAALQARTLDLAIGRAHLAQADDGIDFEHLFDDRMYVVVGHHHPLASRTKVSIKRLAELRWLLPAPGTQTYRQVEDSLRSHGVTLPRSTVSTMSILMRLQLLRTGPFVTAMHGSALHHAMVSGIRVLPIDLGATIPIGISRLRGRTLPPAADAFLAAMREAAAQLRRLSARDLNLSLSAGVPT